MVFADWAISPPLLLSPHHLNSRFLRSAQNSWTDVLLFQYRRCYLPTPQVWDRRRLGAPYSQSILGEAPAKLRQQAYQKNHQGVFKADMRRNSHYSTKAQFLQGAIENARHHSLASVSKLVKVGIQRMKTNTFSHLSSIDVDVDSHSNIYESIYSQTTTTAKLFAYNNQDLLAWHFHSPPSKEILLVCARPNILLGGSRPKARICPPPSLDWVPYFNRRTNPVRLFRRGASIAVMNKDDLSDNTLGFSVFEGLSSCAIHRLFIPLIQFGHKKRHHSEDKSAHSGNSKLFCSDQKEIGRHLFVFSVSSLKHSLKNSNQGKMKFIFDEKGQTLKRQKLERPGDELLSSVFALVLLFIFSLWRLFLYNIRNIREGSLALSRHAPSHFGSSEVVPQQPSSHP